MATKSWGFLSIRQIVSKECVLLPPISPGPSETKCRKGLAWPETTALQAWLRLGLGTSEDSHHSMARPAHCAFTVCQQVVHAKYPLPLWASGTLAYAGQRALDEQPVANTLVESLMSFPARSHFRVVVTYPWRSHRHPGLLPERNLSSLCLISLLILISILLP